MPRTEAVLLAHWRRELGHPKIHNAAKLKRCLVALRSTGNCNTPAQGIRPGLDKVAWAWERIASWRLGHGLPDANCPPRRIR
jgi:hypothetical protein